MAEEKGTDVPEPKAKKSKKKPGSPLRKVSAFLVVSAVLVAGGVAGAYKWAQTEFQTKSILSEDRIIDIPAGSGLSKIAAILANQGVIDNPALFKIMLRLQKQDTGLKAGEFLFPAGTTYADANRILHEGKAVLHRVTFAEGLTVVEIVDQLNKQPGLSGQISDIPPEGSLLPETYSYTKGMRRETILSQMRAAMDRALDELWANRQADLPLKSKQDALILASIVEKETGVAKERGKVAGVFINRLNKRMRLQTDPTVIYGITLGQEALGRPLSRKDLRTETPYNTYRIYGLPPTPISNPGYASLAAVMNPVATDALYFVADGTGGHAFAKTLADHNRNVAKWRKIERSR